MPLQIFSQNRIECSSPGNCDGWLYHKNKIGIGTGWSEAYTPRTTLHLHEFNSVNTYLNITNQTTGFPVGNQTIGMFIGMTGNKATISNFQNDNLVLATGTTERLVITPTGNTGIGIGSPQNILHIHKAIGITPNLNNYEQDETKNLEAASLYGIQLTNNSTGTASTNGLLIGLAANGEASIIHQNAMSLSLGVNHTKVININSNGNVGIGTTSPQTNLEVVSANNANPTSIYIGSGYSNSTSKLWTINSHYAYGFGTDVDGNGHIYGSINEPTTEIMTFTTDGKVGVGTNVIPQAFNDYKLFVKGKILCERVKVIENVPTADYVFDSKYNLTYIKEVENYIKTHKHLPEIPSAEEMKKNGLDLAEMNILLLKKIEELTLYLIEQDKKIEIVNQKLRIIEKNQLK